MLLHDTAEAGIAHLVAAHLAEMISTRAASGDPPHSAGGAREERPAAGRRFEPAEQLVGWSGPILALGVVC